MDDEQALSLVKTEYREGYNSGDVDRVMSVFGEGFILMSEGKPSFYQSEAAAAQRTWLEKLFAAYKVELIVTIIDFVVRGDFAFDSGWEAVTLIPKAGGEPIAQRYRYFETWSKDTAGKWKISGFITNKDLPPEMLPS
jgi:ketosteroid isomerase-like protein